MTASPAMRSCTEAAISGWSFFARSSGGVGGLWSMERTTSCTRSIGSLHFTSLLPSITMRSGSVSGDVDDGSSAVAVLVVGAGSAAAAPALDRSVCRMGPVRVLHVIESEWELEAQPGPARAANLEATASSPGTGRAGLPFVPSAAAMLGNLRRPLGSVLRRLPITNLVVSDPAAVCSVWSSLVEALSFGSCWCSKHSTRGFSTDDRVANGRRGYQRVELKPSAAVEDKDAIIDRIQKSTRELKRGPIGNTLSLAEKRKFLINTLLDLEDSKEAVYSTLDAWVAFEQDFPLASIKQALAVLEKEEQWHRIVQLIKWMLSKGQGNTIRTYEQLVCALEKDNRAEEAHRIWEKKIGHDLHSVPWRFCRLMLAIYYRNNKFDRLLKLFKNLEACGRKPPSKDIIRKVEDAYVMLGLLEEKKDLLENYKDLYNKPSRNDRKNGRQSKKAEKKAADGSKQCKMETSENLPVHSCPSDKEPVASS